MVDFLFVIMELSSPSLTDETLQAEICRSWAFFEWGWVTLSANFRRKGRRLQTTVGVRKLEWLPFRAVSKYPQCICLVLSQRTRVTYGRTDGQTELYDSKRLTWTEFKNWRSVIACAATIIFRRKTGTATFILQHVSSAIRYGLFTLPTQTRQNCLVGGVNKPLRTVAVL